MSTSFANFFKSLINSYNLADLAQKKRGKDTRQTRLSLKKEYLILQKYKQNILSKDEAVKLLCEVKNIDENKALETLSNIKINNVIPMRIK